MPERRLPDRPPLRSGLYLITPDDPDGDRLFARTLPLLPFASCLQLRNKVMDVDALRVAGAQLRAACTTSGVAFIVNDDPRLAHALAADGVHLGEHDGAIVEARTLLGDGAIIGASCYDDLQRARDAVAAGADYVAFGAFFHPRPNRRAPRADRPAARQRTARRAAGGVGGITPDNARPLVAAGADLIAVISGVFDAPDPVAAARAYLSCFEEPRP